MSRMRPLLIGPAEREKIKAVLLYAENHKVSIHDFFEIKRGMRVPPGDIVGHSCIIPVGYRCTFSIEQHPSAWCRHLSVSVMTPDKWPNEHAVEMLAFEFGFRHKLADGKWVMFMENEVQAINVLEPLAS